MSNLFEKALGTIRPKKVNPKETVGSSGTVTYGGYLENNEKNAKLQGVKKYETYSNLLLNTAIVAAGVRYFVNLVGKAEWKVEPADDSEAAIEAAEFIESVLYDMETSWARVIKRSCMYRFYGFSIQEWTAKVREDGKIGLKDIEPRAQSTIDKWDIDPSGTVIGVVQRSPQTQQEIYLPIDKLVYLVDDSLNDSPEGLGLFRHLVDPASRLQRYEVLEGFGFETDLRGVPVAKAPLSILAQKVANGEITAEQKAAMELPLKNFIENHIKNPKLGLLLDSATYTSLNDAGTPSNVPLWGVDLMNVNSTSQGDVANAINRLNLELARVLNVEGLLLGSDSKGSHALSKDKTQALHLVVDSTLSELAEVFDKAIISRLWMLNGFDDKLKPCLMPEAIQFRDVEQITAALRDLATAGATLAPDDPAINEVRSIMGLSDAPEMDLDAALVDDRLEPTEEPEEEESDGLNTDS